VSDSRKRRPGYHKRYYAANREKLRLLAKNVRAAIKAAVFTFYGNGRLQCVWEGCEVCDPDMLTIDHVDNGGTQDRKHNGRGGHDFYRRLQRQGYPQGYQTLCANHQLKKEILRRQS
jgi:hypothetical protein